MLLICHRFHLSGSMSWNDENRSRCLGPISVVVMSYDIGSAALLASRAIYLESGKYSYDLLEPRWTALSHGLGYDVCIDQETLLTSSRKRLTHIGGKSHRPVSTTGTFRQSSRIVGIEDCRSLAISSRGILTVGRLSQRCSRMGRLFAIIALHVPG